MPLAPHHDQSALAVDFLRYFAGRAWEERGQDRNLRIGTAEMLVKGGERIYTSKHAVHYGNAGLAEGTLTSCQRCIVQLC